jgi:hypothetical protein
MVALLIVAGLLALLTAVVHAWLGGREVLRPTLAAPLGPVVRGTMESAWHLLTWHFAVLGVALLLSTAMPPTIAAALALLSGMFALGYAGLFLAVGLHRFRDPWHLPQWVLFVPLAATSFAAPYVSSFASPSAGHLAAVAAAFVFVVLSALHVAWAAGSSFPAKDIASLCALVVGAPPSEGMPGRAATVLVAIGLAAAAGWTLALADLVPSPVPAEWLRVGGIALVAVFGLRGIGGLFEVLLRPSIRGTPYMRWSRMLYSPLAASLSALVGCVMLA